ncbi:unnamed protein product [Fraxinus pennsylvanica]|uniref:O-fucosyltransferase family protein n=1 Tax=Fraxinus pennsylvanica TaxID=56036 RepID=A0AAD1ZFP4_9LAMI|nr:unnamed protein product [Fraxinus pennsylvanica]
MLIVANVKVYMTMLYPLYAKTAFCHVCYNALRLTSTLEKEVSELLEAIPKPFLSLHLRFELKGLTSVYANIFTKSIFHSVEDFANMHGNTKAALDYYVSISSDSNVATYFGNMDKMVAAMRAFKGLPKTLFLSRRGFAVLTSQRLKGKALLEALWKVHRDDFVMGVGSALPDCF